MPKIEMYDIGKNKGGTSPLEITTVILSRIMSMVTEVTAKTVGLNLGADTPVDNALGIGKEALKDVRNADRELIKGVGRILKQSNPAA